MEVIDVCPYCDTPITIEVHSLDEIECPYCGKYFDIDIEDIEE